MSENYAIDKTVKNQKLVVHINSNDSDESSYVSSSDDSQDDQKIIVHISESESKILDDLMKRTNLIKKLDTETIKVDFLII